jgi:uncharacterized protein (TIGR04255 family)
MDRRQYKNPPIQEAVCAIHFAPGGDWDPTYPSLFYSKIRDEYDGKSREQKLLNVEANPKDLQATGAAGMTVNEITRIQFLTKDGKKVVGLYQDDLSVSVLRPYPGWEVFRPSIEKAVDAYKSTAHPAGVRRIGMRYINVLEVDGNIDTLLKCLSIPPASLPNSKSHLSNFNSRNEYIYDDEPIKVSVSIAHLVTQSKKPASLLDVDLVWEWPAEPLPLGQAMSKIDELRRRERVVFESLVTDRARALFDA